MKILAVGMNYPSHQEELSEIHPSSNTIIFFHKGDSILRPNMPFYLPDWSSQIDFEAEIVVQISRVGKYITPRFAHRYYDKVSIGIDFTARDLQRQAIAEGLPWSSAKAFDNATAIGRWIDKSLLSYPEKPIDFSLEVNGQIRQKASTSEMIHSIDEIIAHLSQYHTLKMGDIIFTGTPAGVGQCQVGQTLRGFIHGEELLTVQIK